MTSRASRRSPSTQPAWPASTSAPCEAAMRATGAATRFPAGARRGPTAGPGGPHQGTGRLIVKCANIRRTRETSPCHGGRQGETAPVDAGPAGKRRGPANRDLRMSGQQHTPGSLPDTNVRPARPQPVGRAPAAGQSRTRSRSVAHPPPGPPRHPPSCGYLTPCLTGRPPQASAQPPVGPAQRRPLPGLCPHFASIPPPSPRPALPAPAFPPGRKSLTTSRGNGPVNAALPRKGPIRHWLQHADCT